MQPRARYSVFPTGTYTKDSPERSVGKTCDLAFGYMGGLNAWRKFEPEKFTDDEVEKFKAEWRAAHPAIVKFWYAVDRAAWTAVRERGRVVRCGPVAFKSTGAFLQLKLPSGRKITYPQPRIVGDEREQRVVFSDNAAGQFTECRHGQGAYGGLWTENVVSGIARDIARRGDAADRSRRLSRSCCMCTTRSLPRCRSASAARRIHPSHDAQTRLGAGSADRGQRLERDRATAKGG